MEDTDATKQINQTQTNQPTNTTQSTKHKHKQTNTTQTNKQTTQQTNHSIMPSKSKKKQNKGKGGDAESTSEAASNTAKSPVNSPKATPATPTSTTNVTSPRANSTSTTAEVKSPRSNAKEEKKATPVPAPAPAPVVQKKLVPSDYDLTSKFAANLDRHIVYQLLAFLHDKQVCDVSIQRNLLHTFTSPIHHCIHAQHNDQWFANIFDPSIVRTNHSFFITFTPSHNIHLPIVSSRIQLITLFNNCLFFCVMCCLYLMSWYRNHRFILMKKWPVPNTTCFLALKWLMLLKKSTKSSIILKSLALVRICVGCVDLLLRLLVSWYHSTLITKFELAHR